MEILWQDSEAREAALERRALYSALTPKAHSCGLRLKEGLRQTGGDGDLLQPGEP